MYHFVGFLHTRNISPEGLEAIHIYDYFKTLCHYSKATLVNIRCSLIHCLRFFYENGITTTDMSEYVPRVHYHAKSKIDKVWSDDEIEQMLNSIDRVNPFTSQR